MHGTPDEVPVTIIRPSPGWRLPDPALLWRYRDLLMLLIQRDFTVRYRHDLARARPGCCCSRWR